ncbi:MAG: hypothetical protein KF862_16365 [Chitinophagaceae bacterium]|jgi:hypothetical protein|nr:hypothetical protein [Chitinophagaceae bacterium]
MLIDEPAIREGSLLHKEDWQEYLNLTVRAFRISARSAIIIFVMWKTKNHTGTQI